MQHPYRIVDAHCDTISEILDSGEELLENSRHLSLQKMRQYDGYVQFFAAWIDETKENSLSRTLEIIDKFYTELNKNQDVMQLITDSESLQKTLESGKTGAVLAVEDARAICGSLANLRMLYRLGVRAMTLSWNHDNDVSDGTFSERNIGLTDFGVEVVREMNRIGMIVDVSHMTRKGFWDVLEQSGMPVMASHSNCDAVFAHPRNLDNEQLKAMIKSGGMIGVNFYPLFLSDKKEGIDSILRHIDHILALGGEHCIGLGTDFDGVPELPTGIENAADLHHLFEKMKEIGYSDSLIENISHRNFENFLFKMLKNKKMSNNSCILS